MPQLNPEFFISQIFWLILTFSFLFIFLWRISLPRINNVLQKRAHKISENIKIAKQYQAEAEGIQNTIESQLLDARSKTNDLIKNTTFNLQNQASKELERIDKELNKKLQKASDIIAKNKSDSLKDIDDQIYEVTKLTISKISDIKISDKEMKEVFHNIKNKATD